MNKLTEYLINTINLKFVNFAARYDDDEHDILITDNHHQQLRLRVDDQADKPANRLEYLQFDNPVVDSTIEITNNNQLGDYMALLDHIHTTIANYQESDSND